jgi:hypothetical protein
VVKVLQGNVSPAAQPTLVGGEVRIAFDMKDLTVFNMSQNATVLVTKVTGRLLYFDARLI